MLVPEKLLEPQFYSLLYWDNMHELFTIIRRRPISHSSRPSRRRRLYAKKKQLSVRKGKQKKEGDIVRELSSLSFVLFSQYLSLPPRRTQVQPYAREWFSATSSDRRRSILPLTIFYSQCTISYYNLKNRACYLPTINKQDVKYILVTRGLPWAAAVLYWVYCNEIISRCSFAT